MGENSAVSMRLVVFINEIYNDFYHDVLFFGFAFGNHKRKGDKGIVCNALASIGIIKDMIAIEKP